MNILCAVTTPNGNLVIVTHDRGEYRRWVALAETNDDLPERDARSWYRIAEEEDGGCICGRWPRPGKVA